MKWGLGTAGGGDSRIHRASGAIGALLTGVPRFSLRYISKVFRNNPAWALAGEAGIGHPSRWLRSGKP